MKNNTNNTKKLKILLLTDRLGVGGAETHILSLYSALSSLGHFVTVVSSGGELSKNVRHVTIDLSAHSPLRVIRGYFALRSLAISEGFDIIHAHARLPALIGSWVAKSLKIPLVTTAHARFRLDFLRRRLSAWGFRSVAVSEDLRIYLTQAYSVSADNITVIENGIDFSRYSNSHKVDFSGEGAFNLLFLSRLDSDCSLPAELLCDIAPRLFRRYGNIKITIGGGGECLRAIKKRAERVNDCVGFEMIKALGEVQDVAALLAKSNALVGVSRCAIEALATSIPVIIAGNEGFLGRLTPSNFEYALCSNFCARGEQALNSDLLFASACDMIDNYSRAIDDASKVKSIARKMLDLSVIAPKYEQFYFNALKDYAHFCERGARTLLFGYYGFSNLGDDALLRAAIKRARSDFGASVGALTNKPKLTAKRFAIPCYSRLSPFALFYRILRCERLIFGGGTVFQDGTSRRSLLYYLMVLRLALFLKKDVLLYANGIGQIKSNWLRRMLFSSLKRCSYIGLRDKRSFAILKGSLDDFSCVAIENDLSLNVSASPTSRARFLIYNAFKHLPRISLNKRLNSFFVVCPHFSASRFDRFELDIAIRRQKNKGLTPLFIPCSPYDLYICRHLSAKYGGGIISPPNLLSFSDLLSIFSLSKALISMRYHPLLAARLNSLTMFPIGSDPKIDEFRG